MMSKNVVFASKRSTRFQFNQCHMRNQKGKTPACVTSNKGSQLLI